MHQLIDKKNKIFIYIIFLFILSTTSNKAIQHQKNLLRSVNKISVTGLSITNNLNLEKQIGNFFYKSIFIIGKKDINAVMSEYNIIEEYSVKKIYPSEIDIKIKPTKFIARISSNNKLLVGSNGKLIKSKSADETLPHIIGKFNSKKFLKFKKNIEDSKFNFKDLENIIFFPSNRLDILTTNGILIKLPEKNILKSLNLSYKIIKDYQFKDNKLIDLRITNQVTIQ
jgi:cell division protein FtsQ